MRIREEQPALRDGERRQEECDPEAELQRATPRQVSPREKPCDRNRHRQRDRLLDDGEHQRVHNGTAQQRLRDRGLPALKRPLPRHAWVRDVEALQRHQTTGYTIMNASVTNSTLAPIAPMSN